MKLLSSVSLAFMILIPPLSIAEIKFKEIGNQIGIDQRKGTYGSNFVDINSDDLLDLYVCNHAGDPPSMFVNNGNLTFTEVSAVLHDEADEDKKKDRHGAAWGDFDNDGDPDLYHTVGAGRGTKYKPNDLYLNNGLNDFDNISIDSGTDYGNGRGRGAAWGDFDGDGFLDLFVTTQSARIGDASALFRNNADYTFTNVAGEAGVEIFTSASGGVSWIDYDSDELLDLFFTVSLNKEKGSLLYRNMGDGTFLDVTESSGIGFVNYGRGIAWGDYDNDGDFDVFVSRAKGNRGDFGEGVWWKKNKIYFLGLVKRKDVEDGIDFVATGNELTFQFPFYPTARDYVAPNLDQVFIGAGKSNPSDTEFTVAVGGPLDPTGEPSYTPGVDKGVYIWKGGDDWHVRIVSDGDKKEFPVHAIIKPVDGDILAADTFEMEEYSIDATNLLFRNNGDGTFTEVTTDAGVTENYPSASTLWTDFDNDGFLDLFVLNYGFDVRGNKPYTLYMNNGDGTFSDVVEDANFKNGLIGNRATAISGDIDNDGLIDLFVTSGFGPPPIKHGPYLVYKNVTNTNNNWLQVKLVGTTSNRDGIGAKVKVKAGGREFYRFQDGGSQLYAQNSPVLHFGLNDATNVGKIIIDWPSGVKQILRNTAANQIVTITEPQ